MKVPKITCLGAARTQKISGRNTQRANLAPLKTDCVSFSSNAQYLKKYLTLPPEIQKVLTPKDAIDMFKEMEFVANGQSKGRKIGEGDFSKVYANPWLDGYSILVAKDLNSNTQIIYSKHKLGDSVWQDLDNQNIQIIRCLS